MAHSVVVIPPASPGATTTPTPVIATIPDPPAQPGVSFNGSPAELIQFLRDLGQLQPAPVIVPPPAPLTAIQRFMDLAEDGYWWFIRLLRGIYNLALLVVLCLLAAMAMGWLPGITLPEHFSFGDNSPAITSPVRSSGPSLSEKLDELSVQVGGIKAEVEGLKATPAPVVQEAPPVVEVAPAPAEKKVWRPFAKKTP